jgi:DNA-binding GntR family transcriptional regulator
MTSADITSLDATVRELETVTTVEDYIQLDREFHLRTYARAKMPLLQSMIERFWNSTQHFRRQLVKESLAKDGLPFSDPHHLLLMEAIRLRDAEGARSLVNLHIRRTRLSIPLIESGAKARSRSQAGGAEYGAKAR